MKSIKWILPLVILLVAIIFLVRPGIEPTTVNQPINNQELTNQPLTNQEIGLEPANGNLDSLVNSLINDAENEKNSFINEGDDLEVFNLDEETINSLSQSYDENEF